MEFFKKNNVATRESNERSNMKKVFLNSNQIQMTNLTGGQLIAYVNRFPNYNVLHNYMDKCSHNMKEAHKNIIRLMITLNRMTLKKHTRMKLD